MALVPHGRSMAVADMVRLGAAFNHPLQIVAADVHAGRVPARASAVRAVGPAGVVLGAVKRAEADGSLVLRLLEAEGRPATATIELDEAVLGQLSAAEEVDLLERPLAKGTARLAGSSVSVDLPAHGIASVRLRFD